MSLFDYIRGGAPLHPEMREAVQVLADLIHSHSKPGRPEMFRFEMRDGSRILITILKEVPGNPPPAPEAAP